MFLAPIGILYRFWGRHARSFYGKEPVCHRGFFAGIGQRRFPEGDSLKVIQGRLEHTKFIDSVSYVSADSALADFRRHFSGEMLDLVEGNPIPL